MFTIDEQEYVRPVAQGKLRQRIFYAGEQMLPLNFAKERVEALEVYGEYTEVGMKR
jgi:hypothetical protein